MPGYGSRSAPAGVRGLCAPALILGSGAGAPDQSARRLQAHRGGGARGGGEAGRAPTAGRRPDSCGGVSRQSRAPRPCASCAGRPRRWRIPPASHRVADGRGVRRPRHVPLAGGRRRVPAGPSGCAREHRAAELGGVGGFAAAPEIEADPLVEEEVLVIGHPRLAGRWMSRRDAEAVTWISPYEGSATQAAVEAAWADIGISPSQHLELPNWEAVKLAVARGHGVAGCSEFTVAAELRAGSLGVVRLRGWKVRRTISIVRHREAVLTPSAHEFVTMLHARWHGPSASRRRGSSSPLR